MSDRSVAGRYARAAVARWRHGWAAQTADARRTWTRTVLVGAVLLPFFTLAVIEVAQAMLAAGMLDWEAEFLRGLEAAGLMSFSFAVWYQTFGTDITLAILLILAAGLAIWAGRPMIGIALPIAWVGVDLAVRLGWAVWARSRPDVIMGGMASPGFHSFPSGHTGKTIAAYGILTWLWFRASRSVIERIFAVLVFVFIALVVPTGRMRMGVHWPSDVIAGAVIGLAWAALLLFAARKERVG